MSTEDAVMMTVLMKYLPILASVQALGKFDHMGDFGMSPSPAKISPLLLSAADTVQRNG